MSQPVSAPLQDSVRFLSIPLPAVSSAFLAVGLPNYLGGTTGLPCSTCITHAGVRTCLYTGGNYCQRVPTRKRCDRPTYLLVQACQQLWLVHRNDVYTAIHIYCPYPASPRPLPPRCWQFQPLLTDWPTDTRGYFSRQLHTGGLLLLHVPVGFVS